MFVNVNHFWFEICHLGDRKLSRMSNFVLPCAPTGAQLRSQPKPCQGAEAEAEAEAEAAIAAHEWVQGGSARFGLVGRRCAGARGM